MESYINIFLKTEITIIPGLLDKYIGKYYNNALCNGAAWMFFLWTLLHVVFDDLLNGLLRKMKYEEYIRVRLQKSLWYLGFYTTASIYCSATLFRNGLPIFNTNKPFDSTKAPSDHFILGYIVLSTFYLHSAVWERLKYCNVLLGLTHLCLFLLLGFSYFLRFVETMFRLMVLISLTHITLELTHCTATLVTRNTCNKNIVRMLLIFNILIFAINYLIVVPTLFVHPLIIRLSPDVSILLTLLLIWLALEVYGSVLWKSIFHWINHTNEKKKVNCEHVLECCLFQPRNDATYNYLLLRKEMKEREDRCMSLRKPKNRNMVFQTLKCMMAIKRKLNEKRQGTATIHPEKWGLAKGKHKEYPERRFYAENNDVDDSEIELSAEDISQEESSDNFDTIMRDGSNIRHNGDITVKPEEVAGGTMATKRKLNEKRQATPTIHPEKWSFAKEKPKKFPERRFYADNNDVHRPKIQSFAQDIDQEEPTDNFDTIGSGGPGGSNILQNADTTESPSEEVIGGKLEFNISSKTSKTKRPCKCKKE